MYEENLFCCCASGVAEVLTKQFYTKLFVYNTVVLEGTGMPHAILSRSFTPRLPSHRNLPGTCGPWWTDSNGQDQTHKLTDDEVVIHLPTVGRSPGVPHSKAKPPSDARHRCT